MTKRWFMETFAFDDIQSDGSEAFAWTDIPAGSTLLRSVVMVYVQGISFFDDVFNGGVFQPAAWCLTDTNSTVNPSPPDLGPWSIVGSGHVIGGRVCTMAVTGAIQRFSTTGFSDTDNLTGHTTYDQLHTDTAVAYITGNSYEDSHAQRFFPFDAPAFVIEVRNGAFGSRMGGGNWAATATVKQLFEVR